MAIDYSSLAFPKGQSRYERKKSRKDAKEAHWRAVCAAVDARDGKCCRVCGKPSRLDATGLLDRGHRHHILPRSRGGADTTANVITLCAKHHAQEHAGQITLTGNADQLVRLTEGREERWI